jgi:hypothetical protein
MKNNTPKILQMNNPRSLSPQQLKRLRAYIYAKPTLDHYQFLAKWDISRELIAEVCRVESSRTVNTWFSQSRSQQSRKTYHLWYLTFADLILERFDELPDFLQILLCPIDDDFPRR